MYDTTLFMTYYVIYSLWHDTCGTRGITVVHCDHRTRRIIFV